MAGIAYVRQVVPLVTTLVGTHVAFSVASIARAGIGGLQNNPRSKEEKEECFDAKHYDLVTDWVGRLYRGRGIKSIDSSRNSESSNSNGGGDGESIITGGVKLAPTVTFEDPAAVCVGEEEVREAFRALRVLEPIAMSPPRCIDVQPQGESIRLTFLLSQQYTLPLPLLSAGSSRPPQTIRLSLKSFLSVTVQLHQMKHIGLPESEFLVTEMKELWYGNPLLWPYLLFYVPRRINGVISYCLTSRFL
uniref:Uncharacterized protein n=1 Tax=Pseudo-nitzschia australis TaxID=44445 RepID=A0A7S4ELL0_9STRA|mmetsp:Transcript_24832/g.51419  ORF Transcript_24832/g.51419 Transcript_24832/m.51419 type:complete len:247 (-) Transcript_24832:673-1413(-)